MQLDKKTYDTLKWVALILLPAIGALYFSLGNIWGFPNVEEVVGTITVIDVFLGTVLGISSRNYWNTNEPNAGYLTQVGNDPETGMPHLSLKITKAPEELLANKTVTLKVQNPPEGESR